jgi:hypothetical protein
LCIHIAKKHANSTVVKCLMSSSLRNALIRAVLKEVECEIQHLCKGSMLQQHAVDDLCGLLLTDCVAEWNARAPLFISVLRTLVGANVSDSRIAFMGSSLLFAKNPTMSRIHYATGLILDKSGCTDQVRCVCE